MSGNVETVSVEQDASSVLTVGQGDLGMALVSAFQGLKYAGRGLVSLVCSLEEGSKGVTPVTGRNVCQQTQFIGLGLRLLLLGWGHVGGEVVRLEHCGLVSESFIPLLREVSGPPCQGIGFSTVLAGSVRDLEVES